MPHYEQLLTKTAAAKLVIEARIKDKETLKAVGYDPIVRAELTEKGIKCAPEGAHCHVLADRSNTKSWWKKAKKGKKEDNDEVDWEDC